MLERASGVRIPGGMRKAEESVSDLRNLGATCPGAAVSVPLPPETQWEGRFCAPASL